MRVGVLYIFIYSTRKRNEHKKPRGERVKIDKWAYVGRYSRMQKKRRNFPNNENAKKNITREC